LKFLWKKAEKSELKKLKVLKIKKYDFLSIQKYENKSIQLADIDAQRQMRDCLALLCISNGFEGKY
jgi:hypothetical protein